MSAGNAKCDRCGHRRDHTKTLEGHDLSYTGAYECMVGVGADALRNPFCECFDYIKDGKRADGTPSNYPVAATEPYEGP